MGEEIRYCIDCKNSKLVYTGITICGFPMLFIHHCPICKREYRYRYIMKDD